MEMQWRNEIGKIGARCYCVPRDFVGRPLDKPQPVTGGGTKPMGRLSRFCCVSPFVSRPSIASEQQQPHTARRTGPRKSRQRRDNESRRAVLIICMISAVCCGVGENVHPSEGATCRTHVHHHCISYFRR